MSATKYVNKFLAQCKKHGKWRGHNYGETICPVFMCSDLESRLDNLLQLIQRFQGKIDRHKKLAEKARNSKRKGFNGFPGDLAITTKYLTLLFESTYVKVALGVKQFLQEQQGQKQEELRPLDIPTKDPVIFAGEL